MRRTCKLTLEYDGTDFVGWQYQTNGRSVQEIVEKALSQILREEIKVVGAGRTDSGVHAKGQVASFTLESSLDCNAIVRGLNGVLPDDVAALDVKDVADGFNARYDAKSRSYQYVIVNRPSVLSRRFAWVIGYKLDIDAMRGCLDEIRGTHSFESFCKVDSNVEHHRCAVLHASWEERAEQEFVFEITANRFLYGMVRALVGTMVDIGRGHTPQSSFKQILESKDRRNAGVSAPSKGLFLIHVDYENLA